MFTNNNARKIGAMLGNVIEVDDCTSIRRDFLRVQIVVSVNNSLIDGC